MLFDTLCEIVAVTSILIKFGFDDILENHNLFIAFLNELEITVNGKKVTSANLHMLTQEITIKQKKQLIEEFNLGHEPIYRRLAMYTNNTVSG